MRGQPRGKLAESHREDLWRKQPVAAEAIVYEEEDGMNECMWMCVVVESGRVEGKKMVVRNQNYLLEQQPQPCLVTPKSGRMATADDGGKTGLAGPDFR